MLCRIEEYVSVTCVWYTECWMEVMVTEGGNRFFWVFFRIETLIRSRAGMNTRCEKIDDEVRWLPSEREYE